MVYPCLCLCSFVVYCYHRVAGLQKGQCSAFIWLGNLNYSGLAQMYIHQDCSLEFMLYMYVFCVIQCVCC